MRKGRRKLRLRLPKTSVKRHSLAEQDRIIVQFEAARSQDVPRNEAIAGLGVSLASVYRWQRARNPLKGMLHPTFAQEFSIDAAIARLVDVQDDNRQSFLEALFKFFVWLRWPTTPENHPAAMMVCVVAYLAPTHSAQTLSDLKPDDLSLVLRHIHVDTLKRVCSDAIFEMPDFTRWELDDQPFTQLDYLAELILFILSYEPASRDPRDAVSLNKAYFAMQAGLFKYRWKVSQRTFRSLWHKSGPAAPFLYVERYHSSMEFTLDPSTDDFAACVDEAFLNREEICRFLARCRAVIELLEDRLDPRSIQAFRFPRFPSSLVPETIESPSLPSGIREIIKGFGRSDKR